MKDQPNATASLRSKFLIVSVIVCASVVAFGIVGWTSYGRLDAAARQSLETATLARQAVEMARRSQVDFKKQVQSWKDILIRGGDAESLARYSKEFEAQETATQRDLQALKEPMGQLHLPTDRVDAALRQHVALGVKYREALAKYVASQVGSTQAVDKLVKGIDRDATDAIDAIAQNILTVADTLARNDQAAMARQVHATQILTVIGIVVLASLIVSVLTAFMVSMPRPFRVLAAELQAASDSVSSAASQVAEASQTLAEGASEQAASLEETSSSLEEITSMTKQNVEAAQHARDSAAQVRSSADAGAKHVQSMQSAMEAINSASRDITKILKTIDEIAFQTNILALNAAVEAARAGEAGAGFAVVAEEVRALAQRCASAARETAGKIEEAVAKSQNGVQISGDVARSFAAVQEQIRALDPLVAGIAVASKEQSEGIGQVTIAVSQMDLVTQSNAASAEETAAAAQALSSQSISLNEAVIRLQKLVGSAANPKATPGPGAGPHKPGLRRKALADRSPAGPAPQWLRPPVVCHPGR